MVAELTPQQLNELELPKDGSAPVVAAPWQASAFAIVVALHQAGRFEWREWVELLSNEIASAAPDRSGALHYERWTHALEKPLARLGKLAEDVMTARSEAWRSAYLATPHGRPRGFARQRQLPDWRTTVDDSREHIDEETACALALGLRP
jgi:nitrile hydratase accessory protein